MQVTVSEPAGSDLDDIRAYIARDDPPAAIRMLKRMRTAIDGLEILPNRGRPGRAPGTRELVVEPYIIVYRVQAERVEVVRVRHHAQLR